MNKQTQCEAVLDRLKKGPATTLELIRSLNICCITKRISELRRDGHVIRTSEKHFEGKRVVTYWLMGQQELPLEGVA